MEDMKLNSLYYLGTSRADFVKHPFMFNPSALLLSDHYCQQAVSKILKQSPDADLRCS